MFNTNTPFQYSRNRDIENWVIELLNSLQIVTAHPVRWPLPLVEIAQSYFGIKVVFLRFKQQFNRISGFLLPLLRIIVINDGDSLSRKRFTVGHELGHLLVASILFPKEQNRVANTLKIWRTFKRHERESIANYIAAALLMPYPIIINQVKDVNSITEFEAKRLCELFGVSHIALMHRIKDVRKLHELGFVNSSIKPEILEDIRSDGPHPELKTNLVLDYELDILRPLDVSRIFYFYREYSTVSAILEKNATHRLLALSHLPIEVVFLYSSEEERNLIRQHLEKSKRAVVVDFKNDEVGFDAEQRLQLIEDDLFSNDARMLVFARNGQDHNLEFSEEPQVLLKKYLREEVSTVSKRKVIKIVNSAHKQGKRVVLITGCFDELSANQISFLREAKKAGDILIAGIENDNRVAIFRKRGELPDFSTSIDKRVMFLAVFAWIDHIFVIRGKEAADLDAFYTNFYNEIKPDILAVLDTDPKLTEKRNEIEAVGGRLIVIPNRLQGSSTLNVPAKSFSGFSGIVVTREELDVLRDDSGSQQFSTKEGLI